MIIICTLVYLMISLEWSCELVKELCERMNVKRDHIFSTHLSFRDLLGKLCREVIYRVV